MFTLGYEDASTRPAAVLVAQCACYNARNFDGLAESERILLAQTNAKITGEKYLDIHFIHDPSAGDVIEALADVPSPTGTLRLQIRQGLSGHCTFTAGGGGAPGSYDKQRVARFLDSVRRVGADAPQQAPSSDAARRLQELNDLYNRKLITPQEYETKRKAILEGL